MTISRKYGLYLLDKIALKSNKYPPVFKAIFKWLKSYFRTLEFGLWGEHNFSESDFLKYHVQKDKNSK